MIYFYGCAIVLAIFCGLACPADDEPESWDTYLTRTFSYLLLFLSIVMFTHSLVW